MNPSVISFNAADPNLKLIREAAQQARMGRIVAFPTETVYGIGVPISRKESLERLYQIKGRDRAKPFTYHIGDWDQLAFLNVVRNSSFRYLSKKFWPGPLTLIVQNNDGEKVGIRYPRSLPASALISAAGEPFFGTSANRSGEPSAKTAEEVIRSIGDQIDLLIDGGPCEIGMDSTVVDVTLSPPQMLREGAEVAAIREAVDEIAYGRIPRKKILVVCTGNSCRSPMAAGLLRTELKHRRLDHEIEVSTCGILARDGASATTEAIYVMKNREIDISDHRTRSCRREDILDSDLILAMSRDHYDFLVGLVPEVQRKIKVFEITDPIGLGMSVYEEVVKKLEEKIKSEWQEIIK